jgi:hypothetical protein
MPPAVELPTIDGPDAVGPQKEKEVGASGSGCRARDAAWAFAAV